VKFHSLNLNFTLMRAVRKVSSHFEYLENRSRGLEVTWQLVKGDYFASVNNHSPVGLVSRQLDAFNCVCVLCDRRIYNDRASRSASSRLCACPFHSCHAGFLGKHQITQVCQPTYSPDLAPYHFWLFPELKSPLKGRRCVNATVTQYTSSVNGVSLPTD